MGRVHLSEFRQGVDRGVESGIATAERAKLKAAKKMADLFIGPPSAAKSNASDCMRQRCGSDEDFDIETSAARWL
jgi:hypothetical protein